MAGYIGSKAVNLSTTGADINGDANINGDLSFRDNDKIKLGAGSDLQIYHDGSNSYISDQGAGDLLIRSSNDLWLQNADGTETYARFDEGASTYISYAGSTKLTTTSTGVDVTGGVTTNAYSYLNGLRISGADTGNTVYQQSGDLSISSASGSISLKPSGTNILHATNTGVGIGTSSPSGASGRTLAINGGSGQSRLALKNTNTGDASGDGFQISIGTDGSAGIEQRENNYMAFLTNATERMRIDSSGNVGIGTSSPQAKMQVLDQLKVSSADQSSGAVVFGDGSSTNFNVGIARWNGSTNAAGAGGVGYFSQGSVNSGGHFFYTGDASAGSTTERMRITSAGKIGIGTDAPQGTVVVQASDAKLGVDNAGSKHLEMGIGSGGCSFMMTTGHTMAFGHQPYANRGSDSNFSEKMKLDASGNLLVGKTSTSRTTTGCELRPQGFIRATEASDKSLELVRTGSDGEVQEFFSDSTLSGVLGVAGNDLAIGTGDTGLRFVDASDSIQPINMTNFNRRDNAIDLGNGTYRFDDIYATNGTIQTSDRNEKQDIAELSDAEQRVAVAAKGLMRKFRWRDAVEAKGDEARTHFGIIAQDLQAAFAAEGLDAGDYAMFISSTWTDEETGEERTRMGVRYSELLAFIIGAL